MQALGYRLAAYPCSSLYAAVRVLQKWADYLKQNRTLAGFSSEGNLLDFAGYDAFIGTAEIRRQADRFFK